MQEERFKDYVSKNILELEELTRRYGEFKMATAQKYWNELGACIKLGTPAAYAYLDEKSQLYEPGEHVLGWTRNLEIFGVSTTVTIGFGEHSSPQKLATSWPLLKKSSWTGIRVWLPSTSKMDFLKRAKQLKVKTEGKDRDWILWQYWDSLAFATVPKLYEKLTEPLDEIGSSGILQKLLEWTDLFENIVNET